MPLDAGTLLNPYEPGEPVGAGGMGEVYRARDTRLNRQVAIKISKKQFDEGSTAGTLYRVSQSLTHLRSYDVGPHYLAMEFVE